VVVVAFVPLAFVTGLMGPYMAPMALTVPVAMLSSTAVASLIAPWLAKLVFRKDSERSRSEDSSEEDDEDAVSNGHYAKIVSPFLDNRGKAYGLILVLVLVLIVSVAMPFLGWIPLKLLPNDDAESLQLVIDQPEGATLESTEGLVRELALIALRQQEVLDVTAYTGEGGPVGFNGLVRGYYLREGSTVGDIRINLIRMIPVYIPVIRLLCGCGRPPVRWRKSMVPR